MFTSNPPTRGQPGARGGRVRAVQNDRSKAFNTNNLIQNKKYFINSIKIVIKNKDLLVIRKHIFDGLKALIGDNIKHLIYISQVNNNSTWFISFNNEFESKELFGQTIEIQSEAFIIEDPFQEHNPTISIGFRVMWLPHNFELNKVKQHFSSNFVEQIFVEEECCREEELRHIKNGHIRVKITIKKKDALHYDSYTGINQINGFRCLISRLGAPPKCLLCNQNGHLKSKCPKLEQKCENCNKIGHLTEKCSLSNRLFDVESIQDLPSDEGEEQALDQDLTEGQGQFKSTKNRTNNEEIEQSIPKNGKKFDTPIAKIRNSDPKRSLKETETDSITEKDTKKGYFEDDSNSGKTSNEGESLDSSHDLDKEVYENEEMETNELISKVVHRLKNPNSPQ